MVYDSYMKTTGAFHIERFMLIFYVMRYHLYSRIMYQIIA